MFLRDFFFLFICLFVIDVFVVGFVGGVKFCDCWDKLGFCWTVIILIGIVVVKVVVIWIVCCFCINIKFVFIKDSNEFVLFDDVWLLFVRVSFLLFVGGFIMLGIVGLINDWVWLIF